VEDEEECNQSDEVSFFVDTKRINIVETKISYINVIPYTCIDGEKNLFMYSLLYSMYYFSVMWILYH
jgi:hypothetical protein